MGRFADRSSRKAMVMVLAVIFLSSAVSGCTTLRRKFVRKKKQDDSKDQIVPVLQPEEYQPVIQSTAESYRMHYVILKGYFGDLWDTLGGRENDKRERYVLTQIASKIDAMASLLKDDKQADLKKLSAKVSESIKELDKIRPVRRYNLIKSDLKSVEDNVRRNFKPNKAELFLK